MRVILDTHALLWWITEDPKLSNSARDRIVDSMALVSVVSLWEIAIKKSLGRIETEVRDVIAEVSHTEGFEMLNVQPSHILSFAELPLAHGDPFDRMLVAQAIKERAALVSRDRALSQYDVEVYW